MYVAKHVLLSKVSLIVICRLQVGVIFVGPPVIITHPTGGDVPLGQNITLRCKARGTGMLVYSWERSRTTSNSKWSTVSTANTNKYTTRTLSTKMFAYRCNVSNEAGSVVSNNAIVNVYGEYCPNM